MLEKIKELFTREISSENIIWLFVLLLCGIVIIYFFYILVKACFMVEKQSGRPARNIIKTAIIAVVPSIYCSLVMFIPSVEKIPIKYILTASVIGCIIVVVWNFITYGPIGGVMFSLMHTVFGALASLGVISLIFLGVFLVVMFFFGGAVAGGATAGGGVPSEITDMNTGETFHVSKGANGDYYVERHGADYLIRNGDYNGKFLDSMGNRYRTAYDSDNAS